MYLASHLHVSKYLFLRRTLTEELFVGKGSVRTAPSLALLSLFSSPELSAVTGPGAKVIPQTVSFTDNFIWSNVQRFYLYKYLRSS